MKEINAHPISCKQERDSMSDLAYQIADMIHNNVLPSMNDVLGLCRLSMRAANHGVKDDDYRNTLVVVSELLRKNKVNESLIRIQQALR